MTRKDPQVLLVDSYSVYCSTDRAQMAITATMICKACSYRKQMMILSEEDWEESCRAASSSMQKSSSGMQA